RIDSSKPTCRQNRCCKNGSDHRFRFLRRSLEEVLRQAGIPLLRSHDARKLLQMTGEWLNTTGADQQSPEHRS
ncbi:hypothetical protein GPK76_15470, partial [Escherichia coli]|nr:hypothetical protein [Escherichia coli]